MKACHQGSSCLVLIPFKGSPGQAGARRRSGVLVSVPSGRFQGIELDECLCAVAAA